MLVVLFILLAAALCTEGSKTRKNRRGALRAHRARDVTMTMTTTTTTTSTTTTTKKTQEVTQDRGCCYPAGSAADKWTPSCFAALTEQECAEVTTHETFGEERCYWMPTEVDEPDSDCASTTKPPSAGCCFGSGQGECAYYEDQVTCEKSQCGWIETEDSFDCVLAMTTTSSPSTTDEPGCCVHRGNERRNMVCMDLGSKKCEHFGTCEWLSAEAPECAQGCCTSTVSQRIAKVCSRLATKSACSATDDCVFSTGETECEWPAAEGAEKEPELALFENDRGSAAVQSLSSVSLLCILFSMICAIAVFTGVAVYRRREYIKVADASPVTSLTRV